MDSNRRVLLVDDEAVVRFVTAEALRDQGYHVTEATSGEEALARFKTADHFDILLTDVTMPGGMDGVELASTIRHLDPDIPILITSGFALNIAPRLGRFSSPVTFVHKPYQLEKLVGTVKTLIGERRHSILEEAMKRTLITGIAMIALPLAAAAQMAPAPAPADSSTEASGSVGMAKLSLQDTHFIKVAAIAGMAEVSDGKLAANMGDATVKNIANTMVSDHTKANQQLMSIAKEKGIALPAQVDAQHAAVSAKLKTLSGGSFDKYYLETELKGHQATIDAFKAEASTGSDPDLVAFAKATLPTLEMHLSMIQTALK